MISSRTRNSKFALNETAVIRQGRRRLFGVEAGRKHTTLSRLSIASPSLFSLLSSPSPLPFSYLFLPPIPHVAHRPVASFLLVILFPLLPFVPSLYLVFIYPSSPWASRGTPTSPLFLRIFILPRPLHPHTLPRCPTLRMLAMWPIPRRTGVVRYV